MAKPRKKTDEVGTTELRRAADWHNPRVVQILDAAARCFGRRGFAATSVQDIADEAKLTKSMIHYYFENKQALIQDLQAFAYERWFRKVEQRLAELGGDADNRAQDALWQAFEVVKDKQFLKLQLEMLGECGRDPEVMKRMGVLQRRSRELVTKSVTDVLRSTSIPAPAEVVGTLVAAVLHGLRVLDLVEGDQAPTQEAYAMFVALVLLGLKQFGSIPPPPA